MTKAENLKYFNTLTLQVEKYQKILTDGQISRRAADLHEKKENSYRHPLIKPLDATSEFEHLSLKQQNYQQKIHRAEEISEKNKKMMSDNKKTIEDLESTHKKLLSEAGDSYVKNKKNKVIVDLINKKEKIRSIMEKEANSKV